MLAIGDIAPAFSLSDDNGVVRKLEDYQGSWLILYFYPKDDTPGCTVEACGIRDNWDDFLSYSVHVVGISADSIDSHQRFKKKYSLPFMLLADPEKKALKKYQVWVEKNMFGKKYMGIQRATYIIDPQGVIAKVYPKVSPTSHASLLIKDLAELQQERS